MPRHRPALSRPALLAILLAALVFFPSCQTFRFYGQAVGGQFEILRKSRPIPQVAADPATTPILRRRLATVERIRRFATTYLSLPGGKCFGKYADLGREHVVWVIYATPELSLKPKTWIYPIVGKMDYRGFFRKRDADSLAGQLRKDGYDVHIGGVDAYSTLGWFHDPVLNTFVGYTDIQLAETLFHELTHRKVFRRGDTVFNESLASVVAEEGVKRWLRQQGRNRELRKYDALLVRRREFYQEIDLSRRKLEAIYASSQPAAVKRREKAVILAKLRDQFRELHRRWGGRGLESWLTEDINNGHIVSLKIYAARMPAFRALLAQSNGDFARFFQMAEHMKPR
jgi:predicted aminopeptidase